MVYFTAQVAQHRIEYVLKTPQNGEALATREVMRSGDAEACDRTPRQHKFVFLLIQDEDRHAPATHPHD